MDNTNTNNKTAVIDKQVPSAGSPVGSVEKEQAPINPKVESQIIKASEEGPIIPKEVRDAGVEQVSDMPPLTDEDKIVGIGYSGESNPVHTQPLGMVKLPMSEEEALKTIKTTSNTDSRHWLAVLIGKIYKAVKGLKAVS